MPNDLFLLSTHRYPGVSLKIGSRYRSRAVHLTEDETLQLAYRLMALGKGGETQGYETFPRESGS